MTQQPTWNLNLAQMWQRYPPPIRPSESLIKIFRMLMSLTELGIQRSPKVLVLGSTPELRDLCGEMSMSHTSVDFSRDNFEALSKLLVLPPYNETFFEQDWRSMELKEQFDLVLAEASVNVIPKHDIPTLLERIRAHMKVGGLFISKTWIVPKHVLNLSEILTEYRSYWRQIDFYSFACGLLWLEFYDWAKERVSLREMNDAIGKLFKSGTITTEEFESIQRLDYPDVDLELFLPETSWFLDQANRHFEIYITLLADDPNSHLYPVIVFRAK